MVNLYKIITYPEVKLNNYYAEWVVAAPYLLNLIDDIKKSITKLYVIDQIGFRKTKSIKLESSNHSFELHISK